MPVWQHTVGCEYVPRAFRKARVWFYSISLILTAVALAVDLLGPDWACALRWPARCGIIFITPAIMFHRARVLHRVGARQFMVCPECGYDLHGLEGEQRCPECGKRFNVDSLRREWLGNGDAP